MSEVRVGYILKQYPRLSETFILHEILGVERAGVDVTVFSLRHATEGRFHPDIASVRAPVHYMPNVDKSGFLAAIRALPELDADRLTDVLEFLDRLPADRRPRLLLDAIEVARHVRRLGITHLHAHFLTVAAHTAYIVNLLTGVPFTVTAHAKDIYRHTVDWDLLATVAEQAAAIVTVCDANLRHLANRLDGADVELVRIYNGLTASDIFRRPATRQPLRILGVGRLVEKKGFDLLIEAVARLAPALPDVSCVIVGDGDERLALEEQARRLGVADRVEFTGALPGNQVAEHLMAAHVMAAPCRVADDGNQDALPTVLLEALGAGLPAVATPVAGIPEIIGHDEEGVLVAENDPVALAETLHALMLDEQRWQRYAEAGPRKLASRFDREATIAQLVDRFAGAEVFA